MEKIIGKEVSYLSFITGKKKITGKEKITPKKVSWEEFLTPLPTKMFPQIVNNNNNGEK